MRRYKVVTESHPFDSDDKVDIDVPEWQDVQGWIKEQIDPVKGWVQWLQDSTKQSKEQIEETLSSQRNENAHFDGWLEKLQNTAAFKKDLNDIKDCINKLPETFEKDFRQIIEDNLTPVFAIFAQQIQDIESKLQDAKNGLAAAHGIKRECDACKGECAELRDECQAILQQTELSKENIQEILCKITEQANIIRKTHDGSNCNSH